MKSATSRTATPSSAATSSSSMSSASSKKQPILTKHQQALLESIWWLDADGIKLSPLLDFHQTYICSTSSFLASVEPERYPKTYQDQLFRTLEDGKSEEVYYIKYLFCSGLYLEDLNEQKPGTPVAFQLRRNRKANFYCCLVRTWDRKWTRSFLVEGGAVDLDRDSRWNGKYNDSSDSSETDSDSDEEQVA